MRKVVEILYLEQHERSSVYSKGIVLVLEDGVRVEINSTDVVADSVKST